MPAWCARVKARDGKPGPGRSRLDPQGRHGHRRAFADCFRTLWALVTFSTCESGTRMAATIRTEYEVHMTNTRWLLDHNVINIASILFAILSSSASLHICLVHRSLAVLILTKPLLWSPCHPRLAEGEIIIVHTGSTSRADDWLPSSARLLEDHRARPLLGLPVLLSPSI